MPLFHPYPLPCIETQLPLLKITLKHPALSRIEHALHLVPELFNLSALGSKSVISRLKKKFGDHIAFLQKKNFYPFASH